MKQLNKKYLKFIGKRVDVILENAILENFKMMQPTSNCFKFAKKDGMVRDIYVLNDKIILIRENKNDKN